MWDEEINKKIKEAADQYHPSYDDTAWSDMEKMLDEHLPVKKERRRIIYFLPLVLLLAGLIFFMYYPKKVNTGTLPKTAEKNNQPKSAGQEQELSTPAVASNHNPVKQGTSPATGATRKSKPLSETRVTGKNSYKKITKQLTANNNTDVAGINQNNSSFSNNSRRSLPAKDTRRPLSIQTNTKRNSVIKNGTTETIDEKENVPDNTTLTPPESSIDNAPGKTNADNIAKDKKGIIKLNEVAKTPNQKDSNSNSKQKKIKKSAIQNFGINVSIGPDISAVRFSETGKVTPVYGAGLSYSITDRFTLRTGFYVAKKIYSVDEDEYHVQPGSGWGNYLESVDANCKVYEVPVTLSYNFKKVKNHQWFVSTGLSSYFMKKESYVYFYKYPSGATNSWPWSVANKNKHYFSVLDISGGYAYSINKRFSIVTEPYLKIPLSGIGAGKIKLNSAGILFTLAIKPF